MNGGREIGVLRDASLVSERSVPAEEQKTETRTEPKLETKAEQLRAVLEKHRGERHIIVIQSFPDPDAISSALAHQIIALRFGIASDIAYDGIISHHENLALVELLDIALLRVQEGDDLSMYQGTVFIDTQGTTSRITHRLADAKVPVIAVVDHHEIQGRTDAEYVDIRTAANATASIYTEYLRGGLMALDDAVPEHGRLATALMHGIRSETGGMIRAQREDFIAAAYLSDFIDQGALEAILSIQRSRNAMDIIKTALDERVNRDSYSVAGVGYVRYEDRDAIPQAADFLLTEENVHTAIVYGIVAKAGEREIIVGSLRTKKPTLNPDTFLKEALGGPEPGRSYGGGRREAGGFEIPVGFLSGTYDDEFMHWKWQIHDQQIKRKLWSTLGVEEVRPSSSD